MRYEFFHGELGGALENTHPGIQARNKAADAVFDAYHRHQKEQNDWGAKSTRLRDKMERRKWQEGKAK